MLYKYPQREFPYAGLFDANRSRGKHEPEYELLDTGVFDEDRYFDVFVEYARINPTDVHMLITVHNRGPEQAIIHLLPQLWFRNTWSWKAGAPKASDLREQSPIHQRRASRYGRIPVLRRAGGRMALLPTTKRMFAGSCDGQGRTVISRMRFMSMSLQGNAAAVDPAQHGTKAAAHYHPRCSCRRLGPGPSLSARRLRRVTRSSPSMQLMNNGARRQTHIMTSCKMISQTRMLVSSSVRLFAGMIWSKQYFYYDVPEWLTGDPQQPPPPSERLHGRNFEWKHLNNADIVSMPDKWEYPWYAAWDLAFHCVAFALVDTEFAKSQLLLMTREWYMHPNGQLPAYEWAFGDVNPPVHAWATWRVFQMDRERRKEHGDAGQATLTFSNGSSTS